MKSMIVTAALLGSLTFGTAANATPITYQFSINPLFDPVGGTMAGTFTFDAATDKESNVSITLASPFAGGVLSGVYSQVAPITPPATTPRFGDHAADIIIGTSSAGGQAWVGFGAPLTPAGGLIIVYGAAGPFGPPVFQDFNDGGLGSATPVPEPATLALLLVGLGLRRVKSPAIPPPRCPEPLALTAAGRRAGQHWVGDQHDLAHRAGQHALDAGQQFGLACDLRGEDGENARP
jgi:hypothetical protein